MFFALLHPATDAFFTACDRIRTCNLRLGRGTEFDKAIGNYWRTSHELLLLGVRGRLRFHDRTIRGWLNCRCTVHRRKPEAVRLLIERTSPGPYLEPFGIAEVHAAGWRLAKNRA